MVFQIIDIHQLVIDVPFAQVVQVQGSFFSPFYLAVTCAVFGVRLWSTRGRIFLGDGFRNGFRIRGFFWIISHVLTCRVDLGLDLLEVRTILGGAFLPLFAF